MTQSMRRWMLAAVIAAAMVIASAGMGAAVGSATFIEDVTYPDWSVVDAGTSFTKTWKFQNSGTEDWVEYTFNFAGEDQLGGTSPVNIPQKAPGEFVEISVPLTAPPSPTNAAKTGSWEIRDENNNKVTGGLATIKVTINPTSGPNIPNLSKTSHNKKDYSYFYNGNDYIGVNPFPWGGQCTAFVWGRANEELGETHIFSGNARRWFDQIDTFERGDTPYANSIAVWEQYTHNLFIWDNIPGTDEEKLKNSLIVNYKYEGWNLEWIKDANIEKTDLTITVSNETNSITLTLNDEKTKGNMEIIDGRPDAHKSHILILKEIDNKLNIYKEKYGHVAYVEEVNGQNVIINQANIEETDYYWGGGYDGEPKDTTIDGMDKLIGNSFGLLGYIYLQPIDVPPEDLSQFKSDGITEIPIGGTTNEDIVVMSGVVTDSNGMDVILEVEVQPITGLAPGGTYFENIPNCISDSSVKSGEIARATCTGLENGKYHWQARAKNTNGEYGNWVSAGDNLETSPDFFIYNSHSARRSSNIILFAFFSHQAQNIP